MQNCSCYSTMNTRDLIQYHTFLFFAVIEFNGKSILHLLRKVSIAC